ncbi:hypothetical protein [Campylobacter sp. 19-13652]|nr:hypothetical protein [Campylobacter sp. 19-13652]
MRSIARLGKADLNFYDQVYRQRESKNLNPTKHSKTRRAGFKTKKN